MHVVTQDIRCYKSNKEKRGIVFCNNCGNQLEENAKFCNKCGSKVDGVNSTSFSAPTGVVQPGKSKSINIFEIIAAILMAVGTFLPCYSISLFGYTESVSYIEGDGIIVLIAAIVVIILAVFKKEKFAVIPAAVSIICLIVLGVQIADLGIGNVGFGVYMIWIGSIAAVVLPFVNLKK